MKNITIEQLNEIISTMDLEKIRNGIESFGYRCASKHGKLEFDLMKILDQERATATDDYEDVFEDCRYFAEVFENVKDYEPYTFIVVTQLAIYRNRNNMEFPSCVDIYTDAPINEEYEKSMEEVSLSLLLKMTKEISLVDMLMQHSMVNGNQVDFGKIIKVLFMTRNHSYSRYDQMDVFQVQ